MLRILRSAGLGALIGAASGVFAAALLGALSGIPFIIKHANAMNDPVTMFLAGAVMCGLYIGIPVGAPIGTVVGLLVGAARGVVRARRPVDRPDRAR